MSAVPPVADGDMHLTANGRVKIAAAELRVIADEMRNRKINHGKHTSPTLCAWADRIDAAADALEPRA